MESAWQQLKQYSRESGHMIVSIAARRLAGRLCSKSNLKQPVLRVLLAGILMTVGMAVAFSAVSSVGEYKGRIHQAILALDAVVGQEEEGYPNTYEDRLKATADAVR